MFPEWNHIRGKEPDTRLNTSELTAVAHLWSLLFWRLCLHYQFPQFVMAWLWKQPTSSVGSQPSCQTSLIPRPELSASSYLLHFLPHTNFSDTQQSQASQNGI